MTTAEELLATLHEHDVVDADSYFVINPVTRKLETESRDEQVIMQYDHNSERYTFELLRYVEGHDMMLCNSVVVHWNNIDGETAEETAETTDIYDLRVNPENEETVICSWLITRNSTQRVGILSFLVQYKCVNADGEVTYEWHTDSYDTVTVRKSRNNGPQSVIEYTDILEQWRIRLFGTSESEQQKILDLSAEQQQIITDKVDAKTEKSISAINNKGIEILESIPEDYQTTFKSIDNADRTKADAIICSSEGEVIRVSDSSDDYLRGLKIFGKTTQLTTTGKNLANLPQVFVKPESGYNYDLFTGTAGQATAVTAENINKLPYLTSGTYYINAEFDDSIANKEIKVMAVAEDGSTSTASILSVATGPFTVTYDTRVTIRVGTSSAATIQNIQIEAGDSYTGYESYTGGNASPNPEYPQELDAVENPIVSVYGKNLVSDKIEEWTIPNNYLIFDFNESNLPVTITLTDRDTTVDVTDCYFGVTDDSFNPSTKYSWVLNKGSILQNKIIRDYRYAVIFPNNKETFDKIFARYNVQIELGDISTEYEPHDPIQTLALTRTLPGIPVSQNGNYTDENGQQWICDEIDFERGVYVKRLNTISLPSTFVINQGTNEMWIQLKDSEAAAYDTPAVQCICTHFPAKSRQEVYDRAFEEGYCGIAARDRFVRIVDNVKFNADPDALNTWIEELAVEGIDVLLKYILATPIETALTAEELTAFKYLHTNFPNTIVLNDAGATMKLTYNADTKTYLDNLPKATDEQVQAAVDKWLTAHFSSAEEASF